MLHLFLLPYVSVKCSVIDTYTGGPPYPWVIHSKTYHHGYMNPRIIPNAIYNVIERDIRVTYVNMVKFN